MAVRLTWGEWVKALRAELGAREGKKRPISQSKLAEKIGLQVTAVGKWEMGRKPQKPDRDSAVKLLALASPELRARSPQDLGPLSAASTRQTPDGLKSEDASVTGSHAQPVGSPMRSKIARRIALLVDMLATDAEKAELADQVQDFVEARVSGARPPVRAG